MNVLRLALVVTFAWIPVRAEAQPTVEVGDLERRLLADAADGVLDEFVLLDAALIAGGVQDAEQIARLNATFEQFLDELPAADAADDLHLAEIVFKAMHEEVLHGQYLSNCSRLELTLTEGHYNCVTATVLYQCLCRRLGLAPVAVTVPGHVYTRLQIGVGLDVETTCAEWFDTTTRPNRSDFRELTPVQLVAKVYYNRGVALLGQRRFAAAVNSLKHSLALDPGDEHALTNLLAALNNWALEESEKDCFESAEQLLAEIRSIDPSYDPYRANDLHIHQKWAQRLCNDHCYESALKLLEAGRQRRPQAELFRRGGTIVYQTWIWHLLGTEQFDEALEVCHRAQQTQHWESGTADMLVQTFRSGAQNLISAGRTRQAQQLIGLTRQHAWSRHLFDSDATDLTLVDP